MSLVDKVVEFITTDLNIDISAENKKLIIEKFYPDFKDKLYWSYEIEYKLYEGEVSKEEYENIKTLPFNLHIYFEKISKYEYIDCQLKDIIPFTDDINKLKKFYDRGGVKGRNYFDLMEFFYENEQLDYVEEE